MRAIIILTLQILTFSAFAQNIENREEEDIFVESLSRSERAQMALSAPQGGFLERLFGSKKYIMPTRSFIFPDDTANPPHFIYGVDISHHNKNVPFDSFINNQIKFAYSKATEGSTFTDPKFFYHWNKLDKVRNKGKEDSSGPFYRGAYHFFRPKNPESQADHFIKTVGDRSPDDLPPCLDMEWTHGIKDDLWKKYSGKQITDWALVWLKAIEKEYGVTPIIYTNTYWWNERGIESERLSKYPIWIANYSESAFKKLRPSPLPGKREEWNFWQFTNKGVITESKPEMIDVNSFNGTIDNFEAFFNLKSNQILASD